MHQKALVVGIAAAGCVLANPNHPGEENIGVPKELNVIEARSDGTYTYDPTHIPKWASTVAPEKLSALQSDMHTLATSIQANPLYTSMTAVLATAIPESFKSALRSNPSSVHAQYKTHKPDWFQAIPTDVRSFMDDNRHAAKSIFSKDIGPIPSHSGSKGSSASSSAASSASSGGAKGQKASSEADSLRVVGAAVCALLGALGVAVLML